MSIVLKGGYSETYIENGIQKDATHGFLKIIKRSHVVPHRIDEIKGETITLFIAYGKYGWKAFNTESSQENDGMFQREVNGKRLWCKKENGIWFIGHEVEENAKKETRHSIHQCL